MSEHRPIDLEPAWVLHHRPFRDSSEIIELFTREYGRVAAVARGSRRPGRRRPSLEPFSPILVSCRGRGELHTLTAAELRGPAVRAHGQRLLSMFYLNELVLRLLQKHDPHPDTFVDYERALAELGAGKTEAAVLRVFEKRLLQAMGYGLSLTADAEGQPLEPDAVYRYVPELGPVLVTGVGDDASLVRGASLLALAAENLGDGQPGDETMLRELRHVLLPTLDLYLGGRPLKSREVLRSMRAAGPAGGILAE
jgi:DNA repair protein RecO (recombination protein O)